MPTSLNAISFVLASCSGWSYKASPYILRDMGTGWKTMSQPITPAASKSPIGTRDLQICWTRQLSGASKKSNPLSTQLRAIKNQPQ